MGHAADLGHAEFETGLVATKIITDQFALSVLQEVARMLAGAAGAEVVDDRRGFAELAGGVCPDIRAVGFLCTWREHLHRCFIGMDNLLTEHYVTQCIDQGLQLHARHAHPLGQRGTGNRQAGPTENRFLSEQRQMIGKLGDHDVGQQPGGRDALINDLRRYGCLDQCFAVIADPLATDMTFNGKHAGRVVQLLADIFTNALECAATWAVSVVRLVMNQCAWKLCR